MPRRLTPRSHSLEQLEIRTLPAVTFNLTGGGVLKIKSDAAGDEVRLTGIGSGNVEVRVNGSLVDTLNGVKSIKANLGDGDDTLRLDALEITGSITANLGDGADELLINDDTEIGGSLKANFGGDSGDFTHWDKRVQIGGNVNLNSLADVSFNGLGSSSGNETDDIDIGGNLIVKLANAADVNADTEELQFDNLNVFGKTTITGSNNTDRLDIFDSSFAGTVTINLGNGNDELDVKTEVVDKNVFLANAIFNGGDGDDEAKIGDNNDFNNPQVVNNFETIS